MMYNFVLHNKLRNLKISNKMLALYIGCTKEAVSMWLNGKRTPNDENKKKIVEYTKGQITYDDFFISKNNN